MNFDKIVDFNYRDDAVWLDNKYFSKLGKKGTETKPAQLSSKYFTVGDTAKDQNDYIVYNKKTGDVAPNNYPVLNSLQRLDLPCRAG